VTTQKLEKPSTDWRAIRQRYEGEPCSIRALAREHETTDTAIHRRAKTDNWKRFSAPQTVQRRVQQGVEKPFPWAFETRSAALIEGLKRSRNGVDNAIDATYADLPIVMALLWFRTPLAEIAKAVDLSERELETIFGKPIIKFIQEHYGPRQNRAERRRSSKSQRAA